MGNFDSAFQKVLQNEGKYSNDPDDPGGETYIEETCQPEILLWLGLQSFR
jgi:lysozyme family protein